MKKLLLFVFTILLSLNALAQLEVRQGSFHKVEGFVNINMDKQTDDNDRPYAVLKIRTENIDGKQRRQLNFNGDARTFFEVEYKDGEVWLYISYYASYIKISHDDLSSTEFYFPFDMEPKCGYELTLVNKAVAPGPVKEVYNFMIVSADQPNATIYIDNEYAGEQEVYKSFKAGEKHFWRIECELYHTESGEAVIPNKEGENFTVNKTLRPAFGYMNVTSTPEDGAVVFIDGKKVGQTPFKSDKLASGEHKVRVMKEMFSAAEKTFTVTDGNTTQAAMNMSANFVSVTITTDLESEIYIDNEKKGKGSWSGRLSDGSHALEARKASHKPAIKNVQLVLGKNETIVIPDPEPIYGTLEVVSNPIGANIIIDGKNFGTTPRVLANVLIGTHELRLEKTGCALVTKTITLDEINKLTVNEKLQTGREIVISTDGTGDKIFVDGKYIGDSPITATLSFGEHEVAAIRGYSGDINALKDLNGGTLKGINAINGVNGVKAVAKTITVAQTGGTTSVQLSFGLENKAFTVNGVSFEMIAVKGGTFTMGCTNEQGGDCYDDEKPTHSVTLGAYYIGKFEVTQELWRAVMGNEPTHNGGWTNEYGRGNNYPAYRVSWDDIQEFITKLNQKTGANFRLPTEAEWEYAARGGNKSRGYKYSGSNNIGDVAWYYDNSGGKTHQVGTKSPNELGIYDMTGNVSEWCRDNYGSYKGRRQINPKGPSSGTYRVKRGCSWYDYAGKGRVSNRSYEITFLGGYERLGFRLVLAR